MIKNGRRLLTVIILGSSGVGVFALGMHLAPGTAHGRDLVGNLPQKAILPQSIPGQATLVASKSQKTHLQVADASGDTPGDSSAGQDDASDSPGETFEEVYQLLHRNFVDGIPDDSKLAHGAASAMLSSLQDPESRFMEQSEFSVVKDEDQGVYHGIGAVTYTRKIMHPAVKSVNAPAYPEYRLTIVSAIDGSPAAKAGIKSGDVITDIDGHWLATYDPVVAEAVELDKAQNDPVTFNKLAADIQKKADTSYELSDAETMLDAPTSSSVALTIERPGVVTPLQITVDESSPTKVTPISGRILPGNIGYIKIDQCTTGTDTTFGTTLDGFGNDLKGLVVDLRNCPGNSLEAAAGIAGRISHAGTIGILRTKGSHETPIAVPSSTGVAYPVVVLIDSATSQASELLAATLQSQGTKLIGAPTFGDATDVKTIALRDGSGFTLTVGHLYTSSHADFADQGIKPDIAVPEADNADLPLDRALGILSGREAGNLSTRS